MNGRLQIFLAVVLGCCLIADAVHAEYPSAVEHIFGTTTITLNAADCAFRRDGDSAAWWVDLSCRPWLQRFADDVRPPRCPGIEFLENGEPLRSSSDHQAIRERPGLFSHWGRGILFRPTDASITPGGVYAIRYPTAIRCFHSFYQRHAPLTAALAAALMLAVLSAASGVESPRLGVIAVLTASLAAAAIPHMERNWGAFATAPDSLSYVQDRLRPPVYPLFIRCTESASSPREVSADDTASARTVWLRVVRAQKLFALVAYLALVASVVSASGACGGPAAFICYMLYRFDWVGFSWGDFLMSECLTGALLMACAALTIRAVQTRSAWLLPLLAVAFGAAVATRVAAASGVILLAIAVAAVVVAHRSNPRRLALPLVLVTVIGLLSLAACFWHTYERCGYAALNPVGNYERVAFAMEVADPGDADYIRDPDARDVFETALAYRARLRANATQSGFSFEFNLNCWGAAWPATLEKYQQAAASGFFPPVPSLSGAPRLVDVVNHQPFLVFANRVMGEIADAVLPRHTSARTSLVLRSLAQAFRSETALKYSVLTFPWLGLACLICCLVGRNWQSLLGAGFLASFTLAVGAMCLYELPLRRYLAAAEWVGLLGVYFAGLSAVTGVSRFLRVSALWRPRRAVEPPGRTSVAA
jgi:hypothetical protein